MDERAELLAACRAGSESPELLARLELLTAGPLERSTADVEALTHFARLAWMADQRDPAATRAVSAARRLVRLMPQWPDGYRLLAFAQLSHRDFQGAFQTLTAARAIPEFGNFENYRTLARRLMTGEADARFDFGGHSYWFPLTTHNAAAIEASAFHAVGVLTEAEELGYLKDLLGRAASIAEVGVLIGNHTAFFLNALAPKCVVLIDADPANIPFITEVAARNGDGGAAARVHCAFVAASAGETSFAGQRVDMRPLADLLPEPIDLLKIDVDGGELDLLDGAGPVIARDRPTVMIEATAATHDAVGAWFGARGYHPRRIFDHGTHRNIVLTPDGPGG